MVKAMKAIKYLFPLFAAAMLATGCSDDLLKGNPVIDYSDGEGTACFGDSLPFTVKATDVDVPLSTLKAQLYYGEEMVQEETIRTKESGKDYTGKIYIPYYANIPDGTATLKLVLQNIHFTVTEQEYPLVIKHPDFPYLTLNAEAGDGLDDDQSFRLERVGQDVYEYTGRLPQKVKGKIVAPKVGENGNELVFGYENSAVKVGAEGSIPFSNTKAGKYTISLNTRTLEASPFTILKINDNELSGIDDDSSSVDLTLSHGQAITLEGFSNIDDWQIDPDFFLQDDNGNITFNAISGTYRIIANQKLQYFRVLVLKNGEPASLGSDGTGALWVIGADFGKPSVSANETGWNTEKAVCMAPVKEKVYQMTLVGGLSIRTGSTNFKFFGDAMSWGNEFKHDRLVSKSDLIGVGDGNSHDDGNLYLLDGVTLTDNEIYIFQVDMTAGVDQAVLTVTPAGQQSLKEKRVFIDGEKMTTFDNDTYTFNADLTQGSTHEITGIDDLADFYADPDYFEFDAENGTVKFLPIDGRYRITVKRGMKTIGASMLNGDADADIDNGGAIWLMGWGVGNPSLDYQIAWNPGSAYCMAQVKKGVYQFSGYAGPETGSVFGQRFRYDYVSFKFFGQNGWGFEFSGDTNVHLQGLASGLFKANGNIEFAGSTKLEEGAFYVLTLDITAGTTNAKLSIEKK